MPQESQETPLQGQKEANPIDDMGNVENDEETQEKEEDNKQIDYVCCMVKAGIILLTVYAVLLAVMIYISIRITLDI